MLSSDNDTPFELPFPRNSFFINRPEIINDLDSHFDYDGAGLKTVVLHGLGGYGKTQIALEYAYSSMGHKLYSTVVWVDARSSSTIESSAENFINRAVVQPLLRKVAKGPYIASPQYIFVSIAQQLGINVDTRGGIDFDQEALEKKIAEDSIRILGDWLTQRENERCLLIADNFDNPTDKSTLSSLNKLLPNNDKGHLLVVTRSTDPASFQLKGDIHYVKVGGFDEDKGETLLGYLSKVDMVHLKMQNVPGTLKCAIS